MVGQCVGAGRLALLAVFDAVLFRNSCVSHGLFPKSEGKVPQVSECKLHAGVRYMTE